MAKPRKSGKPKALEAEEAEIPPTPTQSPEEFAKEMFGDTALAVPQDGLPPLSWLKEQFKTKSAAIRYLVSEQGGQHPIKVIAKHLGIRYQHARNVATSPLKRGPNEDWRPKTVPPSLHSTDTTTKEDLK